MARHLPRNTKRWDVGRAYEQQSRSQDWHRSTLLASCSNARECRVQLTVPDVLGDERVDGRHGSATVALVVRSGSAWAARCRIILLWLTCG